ncbi:repeat domain (List_Bact_rpt), partial [Geoalkalibacter ferrihydriticus]
GGELSQTVTHGQAAAAPELSAPAGKTFTGWDGSFSSVTADLSITAIYSTNQYTLTYIAGENGALSGDTVQTVNHGESGQEVIAVPAEGYYFDKWSDGLTSLNRTDAQVTENISVTAYFIIFPEGVGSEDDPYKITNIEQLDAIRDYPDKHFILVEDISFDDSNFNAGEGWHPIGSLEDPFVGTLNGNGHTLRNLHIQRDQDFQGLFGFIDGASIRHLFLENFSVEGRDQIGALAGKALDCTIEEVGAGGTLSGRTDVGGLIGWAENSNISRCFAEVSVGGTGANLGGLVGYLYNSQGIDNYASGPIEGGIQAGGLIGQLETSTILNSYARGVVTGLNHVGGLVGADIDGTILTSFWDTQSSGRTESAGGFGKTTEEMYSAITLSDWEVVEDPEILRGYPFLAWTTDLVQEANPAWIIGARIPPYQITAVAGDGGTADPSNLTVEYGESVQFTLTPAIGFSPLESVGGTCPAGDWNGNIYLIEETHEACEAVFSFAVNTYRVAFDIGDGVSIGGGDLTQNITHGQAAVAPIPQAPQGYYFSGWSRAYDQVTADMTIFAEYARRVATETGEGLQQDEGPAIKHRLTVRDEQGSEVFTIVARSDLPGSETTVVMDEQGNPSKIVTTATTETLVKEQKILAEIEIEARNDGSAVHRVTLKDELGEKINVSEAVFNIPGAETLLQADGSLLTEVEIEESSGRRLRAVVETHHDGESTTFYEAYDEELGMYFVVATTVVEGTFEAGNQILVETDDLGHPLFRIQTRVTRELRF